MNCALMWKLSGVWLNHVSGREMSRVDIAKHLFVDGVGEEGKGGGKLR